MTGKWAERTVGQLVHLHRKIVNPAHTPNQVYWHFSLPAYDAGQQPALDHGANIGSHKFVIPDEAILVSKLNPRFPRVWDIQATRAHGILPIASTEFLVVTPKPNIDRRFLKYLFLAPSFGARLEAMATGTSGSHQRVRAEDFLNIIVRIPPLPEQRAIAHILGTLDDKIERLRRMSETLEATARALFKAWFVDFVPVRAKMEGRWKRGQSRPGLPAHLYDLFPDRLVPSELGEIPEGWKVGTLGEVSHKPQYGYTASAQKEPIGPKFLRIKDINKLPWIEWESVPYCEIPKEKVAQYRVHVGDVLIARMADPGHGVVIEKETNAVFASYLIRFRLRDLAYMRYIQYWLRSDSYWKLVKGRLTGTTRASLNARVIAAFPLIIPDRKTVIAFSEMAGILRQQVVRNVEEARTLAALRDTLLPKLVRGEIRVRDAEKFLERVQA